jgi:hypothetical protein
MFWHCYAMKMRFLLIAVAALVLGGCGLSDQQKADYASVQRAGVPAPLYDKMVHGQSLSIEDVIALSRAGVRDDVLTRYIRDQGTVYRLNRGDIQLLRNGGVSGSVIDFMVHTEYRGPDSPWGP